MMENENRNSLKKAKMSTSDSSSFKSEEVINYEDGSFYTGSIKNGLKDGKGKLVSSEITYEGEFKNDFPNG